MSADYRIIAIMNGMIARNSSFGRRGDDNSAQSPASVTRHRHAPEPSHHVTRRETFDG
ncbi:hypothetical protein RB213_013418, partial [Colletotrichum asianum]